MGLISVVAGYRVVSCLSYRFRSGIDFAVDLAVESWSWCGLDKSCWNGCNKGNKGDVI